MRKRIFGTAVAIAAAMLMSVNAAAVDLPFVPVDGGTAEEDATPVQPADQGRTSTNNTPPIVTPTTIVTPPSTSYTPTTGTGSDPISTSRTLPSYTVTEANTDNLEITANVDENGYIHLEWDRVYNANKYLVYVYNGKRYAKAGDTAATSYTYKDTANGKSYRFLVRYSANGTTSTSAHSFKLTVKVYYKPIIKASEKNGQVTLKWNAVPGATKYAAYRYSGNKLVKIKETENRSVKIKKKSGDTGYAVKAYVNGKWTTITKDDKVSLEK